VRGQVIAVMDKYESFSELETCEVHGTDYRWRAVERRDSPVVIVAPHGGGIEIGTSQLAARIARARHSLFLFEGLKPPWQNRSLHITSHKFDHPRCLALVARSLVTLAVHGCKGDSQIYVGGLDVELKTRLTARLNAAGLPARAEGHSYLGRNPLNICNRGLRGCGVQLEFTRDFRGPAARKLIAPLIRDVLLEHIATLSGAPENRV
jgi:phage replication-related protein YjqB (UPF0714/DUF867 family)